MYCICTVFVSASYFFLFDPLLLLIDIIDSRSSVGVALVLNTLRTTGICQVFCFGQHGPKNEVLPTSVCKHTTELRLFKCFLFGAGSLISCLESQVVPGDAKMSVFNLLLDGSPTWFANGLLTHSGMKPEFDEKPR